MEKPEGCGLSRPNLAAMTRKCLGNDAPAKFASWISGKGSLGVPSDGEKEPQETQLPKLVVRDNPRDPNMAPESWTHGGFYLHDRKWDS